MATQVTAKTAADYPKILLQGTQASYAALATKDPTKLYFCTDTGKLYKGEVDFTEAVRIVTSDPVAANALEGVIYVNTTDGFAKTWDGTKFINIGTPVDTSTGAPIGSTSGDAHVPSSKNVYDFVEAELAETVADTVTGVAAKVTATTQDEDLSGKLVVTKGQGASETTSDVVVPKVIKSVNFDAATRTFTFKSTTDSDVTVQLAKDIFIDPTADNRYDPVDQSIHLYLNDGEGTSEPTELVIPVASLIATIEVADTNSIDMTLTTRQKTVGTSTVSYQEIKADLVLRPDDAQNDFTNALKVGNTGAYVDLKPVEDRLDIIEGDDTTSGSIAYAVKQLADGQVADNTTDIGTLDDNMALLASATTTWGSF